MKFSCPSCGQHVKGDPQTVRAGQCPSCHAPLREAPRYRIITLRQIAWFLAALVIAWLLWELYAVARFNRFLDSMSH